MNEYIVSERHGAVSKIRLNRPHILNAWHTEMRAMLVDALEAAQGDSSVRAIVMTGTGDRAFCAGMDLRAFAAGEQTGLGDDDAGRAFLRLTEGAVAVPLVGAANGTALAGGFELLLGCDVIIASSEAKFGLPEVKRGLFPAGGGTFLGTRVGLGIALEMALTGDPISAERAHDLGLVNTVVPPDEVLELAVSLAERIAANGPLAVAAVKELVRLAVTDPARARERLHELRDVVFNSEDAKEGAMAFVEKRTPAWRGR
jgi:enoyl-CoA hydratase